MSRIMFFATRDDLLAVLGPIERVCGIRYYPFGRYPESSIPQYTSADQIPNLSLSLTGMDSTDPHYLILPSSVPLALRTNKLMPEVMFVDNDCNLSAVGIIPGGCFGDDCIIQGTFFVESRNADAMQLLKRYRRSLCTEFRKIIDCYVGPVAYDRWQRGTRLTDSARSSRDRDLRNPE